MTARCLHCGGELVYHRFEHAWLHTDETDDDHAACPDKINPENWK